MQLTEAPLQRIAERWSVKSKERKLVIPTIFHVGVKGAHAHDFGPEMQRNREMSSRVAFDPKKPSYIPSSGV